MVQYKSIIDFIINTKEFQWLYCITIPNMLYLNIIFTKGKQTFCLDIPTKGDFIGN